MGPRANGRHGLNILKSVYFVFVSFKYLSRITMRVSSDSSLLYLFSLIPWFLSSHSPLIPFPSISSLSSHTFFLLLPLLLPLLFLPSPLILHTPFTSLCSHSSRSSHLPLYSLLPLLLLLPPPHPHELYLEGAAGRPSASWCLALVWCMSVPVQGGW